MSNCPSGIYSDRHGMVVCGFRFQLPLSPLSLSLRFFVSVFFVLALLPIVVFYNCSFGPGSASSLLVYVNAITMVTFNDKTTERLDE
jgi:hypothetical protein